MDFINTEIIIPLQCNLILYLENTFRSFILQLFIFDCIWRSKLGMGDLDENDITFYLTLSCMKY